MSWQWRMIQYLKRNWLVSSKLTWGIWQLLTRALENPKSLHFNKLLLTKAYNAQVKTSIEELCLVTLTIDAKTDLCFLIIFVDRLKNSDFIWKVKWQNSIESRTYWFILKIARMFPILMSRNRLMNTFIVNITPTCKR